METKRRKPALDEETEERILGLPADFADELAPFVRAKYQEIWRSAQVASPS